MNNFKKNIWWKFFGIILILTLIMLSVIFNLILLRHNNNLYVNITFIFYMLITTFYTMYSIIIIFKDNKTYNAWHKNTSRTYLEK